MTYSEKQMKKLADFLLENYPRETDEGCFKGEGFVDVAIRLLSNYKAAIGVRNVSIPLGEFDDRSKNEGT
jgi:hypothetical protein